MAGEPAVHVPGPGRKPYAVVVLPWLGERSAQSVEDVARCLAMALDRSVPDRSDHFAVVHPRQDHYGLEGKHTTNVRSIVRSAGGQTPCIDVYDMVYAPVQTAWFADRSLASKTFRLLITTGTAAVKVGHRLFGRGKALRGSARAQVFLALGFLGLMSAYGLVLAAGVAAAFYGALTKHGTLSAIALPAGLSSGRLTPVGWLQMVALGLTAAGLGTPKTWRQLLERAAVDYHCAFAYIHQGKGRDERTGRLADLLEHLVESDRYGRIDVVAYSFGSLIALDAFFPPCDSPRPDVFSRVHTLVTVGCPADFVRLFWKGYYKKRQKAPGLAWVNVYTLLDVLSSNFRNDGEAGDPLACPLQLAPESRQYATGLLGEKLGTWKVLTFMGLRSHAMYWPTAGTGSDIGCFNIVVEGLYSRR